MLTVSADSVVVESQLAAGVLSCPGCGGVVAPWGHARERTVVGADRVVRVRPRRARCRCCLVTHVLLPAAMLLRRGWAVEVIGRALELFAIGMAVRRVAGAVAVSRSTVRGWLARFAVLAEVLRAHFTRWALWLEPAWTRLQPQGSPVADALAALLAAAEAARRHHGSVSVWQFASTATGGRLLCNTTWSFPAPWAR